MEPKNNRVRRHYRLRKRLSGTTTRPRLAVFKSSQHIYAQIIDDSIGKTLVAQSDIKMTDKGTKSEAAFMIGKKIAEKAIKQGITQVVFDRGGFLYHGRIKSVAIGAREGGLQF